MFAESPGLNAVEHAVYDVWLKGCKDEVRRAGRPRLPRPTERLPRSGVNDGLGLRRRSASSFS